MAARFYTERRYGMRIEEEAAPYVVTIGTTPTLIARHSADRLFILMINLGANDAFVTPDGQPSTTRGIRVTSNGGSAASDVDEDGEMTTFNWYGVVAAGTTTIYVHVLRGIIPKGE